MWTRLLFGTSAAVALAQAAVAADLTDQLSSPPQPPFSWTGIYLGGHVGYAWARDNSFLSVYPPVGGTQIGTNLAAFETNPHGVIGGAHIGYNYQLGFVVLGLEGDVDGSNLSRTVQPLDFISSTTNSYIHGSIRGRIGLVFDRILLYATGGGAYAGIRNIYNVLGSGNSFSTTRSGWTIGSGLEYSVNTNWSARAEYRYTDFGNFSDGPIVFPDIFERHHWTEQQIRVGFSYKFTPSAPPPLVSKF